MRKVRFKFYEDKIYKEDEWFFHEWWFESNEEWTRSMWIIETNEWKIRMITPEWITFIKD